MSDARRYGDDEVAAIFQAAAKDGGPAGRALPSPAGLTLAELQAIGGEVGIAPARIAEAAAALDVRGGATARRTSLGLPLSVGRTVELPRAPTDREWEMLVSQLRETFGAHGRDRSEGGLRAWRNGNLHAYVEPTEEGHRLRLGTLKGDGVALERLGLLGLVMAVVMTVVVLAMGEGLDDAVIGGMLALFGVVALGSNALRLPRWAREREQQMEQIAARARALIRPDGEPTGG